MTLKTSPVLYPLLLGLAFTIPAFPSSPADGAHDGPVAEDSQPQPGSASKPAKPSGDNWHKDPSDWDVRIYPIFAWLPVFGANVALPETPSNPGAPGSPGIIPEGSTSGSVNGAVMAGFRVQKSKWAATGSFLWAGLSGDRTTPKVHIGMDILYGQVLGGREVLPNLYLEGGVRRMALNVSAKVGDYPEVGRKPGVWDPIIGVTWDKNLGKNWKLVAHMDGGGFGVGSDITVGGDVHADWRFAKHFGLGFGFGVLHFKISDNFTVGDRSKTLTVDQTMYGPIVALGIYF
jgi:hypothetical protein